MINLETYQAAQNGFVMRDMSHFGRFKVSGADAATLLHHLTTQDIKGQKIGEAREAVLISNKARVLDWLTILRLETDVFRVITSPNRRAMFAPHAQKFVLFRQDVKIEDETGAAPLWGAFGPKSNEITGEKWPTKRLPNSGLLSFEAPQNAVSCDNETFNVLRIEAGIPVAGLELTEEVNPWEAGFESAISLAKGCYNGQEIVARLHAYKKIKQGLFGLKLETLPLELPQKLTKATKNAGFVTSAIESPRFGAIALGFVRGDFQTEGETLELGEQEARVSLLPFDK
ncbi:aminomethyltransferase [Abditibacterium utsteinense]|uniref:Aminomethyltransferase n=2 Tax=Abditibacterium utsteinense TaxID=1960156 RepID=A0A2S8SW49_9BACT|nr:aminomethyltransferase [Abditibacterium utsteinense]